MSWTYTEQYSGNNSILFKNFVDSEFGDNDGFIAAWELLNTDVSSRDLLLETLDKDADVKIDDSSAGIKTVSVESDVSMEILGPVNRAGSIVNTYEVQYAFDEPISSLGNRIWFLGEPGTHVTINLPENVKVISTEGINNATVTSENSGSQVSGNFGLAGEAVIYFEADEIYPGEDDETVPVSFSPAESKEKPFRSLVNDIFPGFTEEFLETLKGNSAL